MDFSHFLVRRVLMGFFVSVTCITAAMALIGMAFQPEARFGYEAFLSPLLFGLLTSIPTILSYSGKELTLRQALVRNVMHLVALEALVLGVLALNGVLTDTGTVLALAIGIAIIFVTVHLLLWVNDRKTADTLNRALKAWQDEMAGTGMAKEPDKTETPE